MTPQNATRVAIEALTLWLEDERHNAAAHIADIHTGPDAADKDSTIAGLLNLAMILGMDLAKANGAQPDDFRSWLNTYLQKLSLGLPGK
ncbi:hypothetical protein [Streptomyces sp. NPDC088847]|uniref:hypothetical protein n=1 Tax=Streptomyces sp. NPDC088847 TaxID=3365909 RepID=UPI0037FC1B72